MKIPRVLGKQFTIYNGDCIRVLAKLEDATFDSVVVDPPYGLSFMGRKWDAAVPPVEVWKEVYRVLKPGAHLLSFAGTRTHHRMATAIEDAGFEIRDMIAWVYGSGFPKSHNVSKAIDKIPKAYTRLSEFAELLKKKRKENGMTLAEADERITNGSTMYSFLEGRNLHGQTKVYPPNREHYQNICDVFGISGWDDIVDNNLEIIDEENGNFGYQKTGNRWKKTRDIVSTTTNEAQQWDGWGTALKPAMEPIVVARKPLTGTVAENVLQWGTGAINVDGCRVGTNDKLSFGSRELGDGVKYGKCKPTTEGVQNPQGRFPANFIHDGSDEVVRLFPMANSARASGNPNNPKRGKNHTASSFGQGDGKVTHDYRDIGSAARFFYCASYEKEDLLFCRARAISSAWELTKGEHPCSRENASVVGSSLCLSRQAAGSVLSDAVIAVSRGDRLLSDVRGLSTTVTESECETLCETLITAMLIFESVALPAPSQDALIQNGCRVSIAATQKPTDTTTITISLPTSGGYAEPVTFDIMPSSMVHGAKDSSASRFRYCAKASKKDRDEGLDGFDEKPSYMVENGGKTSGLDGKRYDRNTVQRNNHPTVKPTDLMRYLVRLVTPPGGTVLDPFMGSGSTGKAAIAEGFFFHGIDNDPEAFTIAKARLLAAEADL